MIKQINTLRGTLSVEFKQSVYENCSYNFISINFNKFNSRWKKDLCTDHYEEIHSK